MPSQNTCAETVIRQGFKHLFQTDVNFNVQQRNNDYQITLDTPLRYLPGEDHLFSSATSGGQPLTTQKLKDLLDSLDTNKQYIFRADEDGGGVGHYQIAYYKDGAWRLDDGHMEGKLILDAQNHSPYLGSEGKASNDALCFYELTPERLFSTANYVAAHRSINASHTSERDAERESENNFHASLYRSPDIYQQVLPENQPFWNNTTNLVSSMHGQQYWEILAYQAGVLGDEKALDTMQEISSTRSSSNSNFYQAVYENAFQRNHFKIIEKLLFETNMPVNPKILENLSRSRLPQMRRLVNKWTIENTLSSASAVDKNQMLLDACETNNEQGIAILCTMVDVQPTLEHIQRLVNYARTEKTSKDTIQEAFNVLYANLAEKDKAQATSLLNTINPVTSTSSRTVPSQPAKPKAKAKTTSPAPTKPSKPLRMFHPPTSQFHVGIYKKTAPYNVTLPPAPAVAMAPCNQANSYLRALADDEEIRAILPNTNIVITQSAQDGLRCFLGDNAADEHKKQAYKQAAQMYLANYDGKSNIILGGADIEAVKGVYAAIIAMKPEVEKKIKITTGGVKLDEIQRLPDPVSKRYKEELANILKDSSSSPSSGYGLK